ncbi:MAG: STAS domain-containing protein [Catenulisporales bacterium]|jgi:anti-sigma B factor antagonist|nr:STAS domain-containing protein [Catenulisporales bacterium]
MDEFTVSTTTSGTAVRVAVRGDVDLATAEQLQEAVSPLIRAGCEVAVDCAEIQFLDSAGLRVLLELNRRAGEAGGELVLVALSDIVSRVLDLAGVAQMFTVRPGPVS